MFIIRAGEVECKIYARRSHNNIKEGEASRQCLLNAWTKCFKMPACNEPMRKVPWCNSPHFTLEPSEVK